MNTSQIDRFLAKIEQRDGCWVWTAGRAPNGYGKFKLDGRTLGAHRVSYEYFVATIASGLEIDHLCRNRACVNPMHLEAVTHSVNVCRGLLPAVTRVLMRGNTNFLGLKHTDATKRRMSEARRDYCQRKRAERTHCPRGHAYDAANTYLHNDGRRSCLTCRRDHYWKRKREAA